MPLKSIGIAKKLAAVVLLVTALAPSAFAVPNTLYVANNGVDSSTCGFKGQTPCASISQAVTNAAAGDTIMVGPGTYGPVEIDKRLTVLSSDGAASTVIDGTTVLRLVTVLLTTGSAGSEFGRPGQGFTVTNTRDSGTGDYNVSIGIGIDDNNVKVRGNQAIFVIPNDPNLKFFFDLSLYNQDAEGIVAGTSRTQILIDSNQIVGWGTGIVTPRGE